MTRKKWLLVAALLVAFVVVAAGNSGEGAGVAQEEPISGTASVAEQIVQVEDKGAGYEFTEPGVYTVAVGLSDDGGKTVVVSSSVTVIVRECIWMPIPTGGVEYICYISNEERREGFVTTPEDVEKATLDYLKSIGY